MESNNPKEFWAIINRMRNWGSETNDPADNIEASRWCYGHTAMFLLHKLSKHQND